MSYQYRFPSRKITPSSRGGKRRRVVEEDFEEEPPQGGEIEISPEDLMQMFTAHRNDNPHGRIYAVDNHIYFHSHIDEESSFRLKRVLSSTIKKMEDMGVKYDISPPPIKLHITSNGGHVFESLSIVGIIESSPVPIHSIIEGNAASGATLISVSCHRRYIQKHSFMLIHQMSGGVYGKVEEIMDEAENCKTITNVIEDFYLEKTSIPRRKLRQMFKHDLWLSAGVCLEKGLVDEIIE